MTTTFPPRESNEANVWQPSQIMEIRENTKSVEEKFVATAGQTEFTIVGFEYTINTGALAVYKNGLRLIRGEDWNEVSNNTFALTAGAALNDEIVAAARVGIDSAGIQVIVDASETATTKAAEASASALAASISETNTGLSEVAAGISETNAGLSEAATAADAIATAADRIQTGLDATAAAASALAAADSESVVESLTLSYYNFQGDWSSLVGALNKPATVRHNGLYWILLNDLADVTLSEPGVSADWGATNTLANSFYDGTNSGLGATTGQGAVDETMANMSLGVNDIINGQFKIAQTGTSFVSPASFAYDLDGWQRVGAGGAVTITRVAGSVTGSYARESNVTTAKVTLDAGDSELAETRLLGYDCVKYINQPFVVSLRVKSGLTGIRCVSLYNGTSSFVHEFNILAADTYQDVVIPVPMGVPALNSSTNTFGFIVRIAQAVGTTRQTATTGAWAAGNFSGTPNQVNGLATVGNKLTFEDVRINLGTVPLPNVTPYDAELARCRRYVRTESLYFRATAQAATNYTYAVYQIGNEMNGTPSISVTWSSLINCGTPALQFADSFMVAYAIASTAAGEFRGFTSAGGLLLKAQL